jgi:flavin-binding protein dodecin
VLQDLLERLHRQLHDADAEGKRHGAILVAEGRSLAGLHFSPGRADDSRRRCSNQPGREDVVPVAKVIEVTASSPESFEDAVRTGIEKSGETLRDIRGAWVSEQKVDVENGSVSAYRVTLRISFVLE